jgi:hypothetical protein
MQVQRLSLASPLHESQNYHWGQSAPEESSHRPGKAAFAGAGLCTGSFSEDQKRLFI